MMNPQLYNENGAAAGHAAARDTAWFRDNPKSTCRIRPLLDGESPIVDAMIAGVPGARGYAVVIHHARLGDKRRAAGVGIYPHFLRASVTDDAKSVLLASAKHAIRHFRKSASSPPPAADMMVCS